MALYKLYDQGVVSGGTFIPENAGGKWQDYLAWVALGNTADPADQPTVEQVAEEAAIADAPITTRAWFAANPSAKLIWSMSVVDLATEIDTLVDALFPSATAANRTKLKLLLKGITLAVRVLVKRERLLI